MKKQDISNISKLYNGKNRSELIPILQDIQNHIGFIPKSVVAAIADNMNIPTTKIHGVITFYKQFRYNPGGTFHIRICRGTACHMNNSKILLEAIQNRLSIKDGETDKEGKFSLEIVPCLGACNKGPVIGINNEFYTGVNQKTLDEILSLYQNMK
ncbi:MAG: NAD(P)H-dependent oxidoreductase subunit E [Bacteroidales bacterium]|nr:NAD(P)H-dependent oxidoreductase subunit E [Bacteroidales bacterium]